MILKLKLKSWVASISLTRLTQVVGVHSNLKDGRHILMWDFDDLKLIKVRTALAFVQWTYHLPKIYILNTGTPHHYIAYCFKALPWIRTVEIIAATKGIDQNYFRLGVIRKHWTLRISDKEGRKIKLVYIIPSKVPEDTNADKLFSYVRYNTMKKGTPKKVITIGTR